MKRILLVILLLFGLYGYAFGAAGVDTVDTPAGVDTVSSPASVDGVTMAGGVLDHCSACTVADADVVCEDFEGAGYLCTVCGAAPCWAESVNGTGAVNEDAAHSPALGTCTDEGSQALSITVDPGQVNETCYNIGSAKNAVYVKFYVTYQRAAVAGNKVEHLALQNSSGTHKAKLYFLRSGTDYQWRLNYDAGAWGDDDSTTTTFADNTWYKVELTLSGTSISVDINDSTEMSVADYDGTDIQYICFGDNDGDSDEDETFQVDNVKVDDDTMPGDCS